MIADLLHEKNLIDVYSSLKLTKTRCYQNLHNEGRGPLTVHVLSDRNFFKLSLDDLSKRPGRLTYESTINMSEAGDHYHAMPCQQEMK